jgi:hypothetical protein
MQPRHAAALAILLVASNAFALTGEQYLSQAKLPLPSARKLALKAYPGKIVSEELEQEAGGSGLRYSFVIRHNQATHEVGIGMPPENTCGFKVGSFTERRRTDESEPLQRGANYRGVA